MNQPAHPLSADARSPSQGRDPGVLKHILFVDDNPSVLGGLRRMLHSLRTEWEMTFVQSGAEALALMAAKPFDVVVSDMRMPGMNGAELLSQVMQRYPRTVRLILSGHADQDLILKCVGSTHQYLAKPCEAESLKTTIRRATTLGAALRGEAVMNLVSKLDRVPSAPALYFRMVEALHDPRVTLNQVSRIVEQDPGMSAKILQLANSAFFGLGHPVANLFDAVSFLGVDTIKSLVLGAHAFSQYEASNLPGVSLEALRSHSLHCAVLARQIALSQCAPAKLADEAFIGGLLHDTGKLVLASNRGADYGCALRGAKERHESTVTAEENQFGCNHAEVGAYLLGLWGLPVPVVEAVALHHRPQDSAESRFSPTAAVHLADALAHYGDDDLDGCPVPELNSSHLARLGLEHDLPMWARSLEPQPA